MATSQRKDGPVHCTWHLGTSAQSPHQHYQPVKTNKIMDTILENIGDTPLVRLHKIPKEEGIACEILVKCEYFNAGGSVKDRIGKRMVEDAEKSGRIKKGDTLIEPTSGNTGIGLALAAAVKGYKMVITLPEKMSQEKVDVLKGLGAQIIRTPTEAAWDSPESHIGVAKKLNSEIPNSHILDQYKNPSNPLAHYDGTAEEILSQTDGKLDMVVITAGTGGTLTGIARKIKEKLPHVKIVGVDPVGSILALPETLNGPIHSYKVEGIGYDFIPPVLARSSELVAIWVKTEDKESFLMARRMIREEGLLCGGSSGTALVGAFKAIRELKLGPNARVVVILPDSVRNYMTKFLNDGWLEENNFTDKETEKKKLEEVEQWGGAVIKDLKLSPAIVVKDSTKCSDCIDLMKKGGFDQVPVTSQDQMMLGYVTIGQLLSKLASGRAVPSDPVTKVMLHFDKKKIFQEITYETKLSDVQKFFEKNAFAFVTNKENNVTIIKHVVTKVDLLEYLMNKQ